MRALIAFIVLAASLAAIAPARADSRAEAERYFALGE